MQLLVFAMVVAIIFVFVVDFFPLNYPWRRGLSITVVLIAFALFVLVSTVRDKLKQRT